MELFKEIEDNVCDVSNVIGILCKHCREAYPYKFVDKDGYELAPCLTCPVLDLNVAFARKEVAERRNHGT